MTGFTIAELIGKSDDSEQHRAKQELDGDGPMRALSDYEKSEDAENCDRSAPQTPPTSPPVTLAATTANVAAAAATAAAAAAAAGFPVPTPLRLWGHFPRLPGAQQPSPPPPQMQQQHSLLQQSPDHRLWLHALHARFQQTPAFGHPGAVRIPAPEAFLFQGYRKPKRIRTAFSPGQLLQLEQAFEKNHYVVGQERKELAAGLNLSETQVKVWFQNRRTKYKRVRTEDESQQQQQHQQSALSPKDQSMPEDDDDIVDGDCTDEELMQNQFDCGPAANGLRADC